MDKPLVAIIMGSASDKPVMDEAVKVLEEFNVPFEVGVMSAHRTPAKVSEYAAAARDRGIGVIIAAAGKAAHLAGAVAARTTLPVIGVPVAGGDLGGMDALLSTVQMPSGVPVATVAINGAKNAAVLAVQILALSHSEIAARLDNYKSELAGEPGEGSR